MGGYSKAQLEAVFYLLNMPITWVQGEENYRSEVAYCILETGAGYVGDVIKEKGKNYREDLYWPTDAVLAEWIKNTEAKIAKEKKYLSHLRRQRKKLVQKTSRST